MLNDLRNPGASATAVAETVKAKANELTAGTRRFMNTLVTGFESKRQQAEEVANLVLSQLAAGRAPGRNRSTT